jgi:RimJ/RimL family protein N-acetyltransferase
VTGFVTDRLTVGNPRELHIERRALTTAVTEILTPATTRHFSIEWYGAYDEARAAAWVDELGEALLLAVETSGGRVVGLIILATAGDDGDVHLGHVFAESVWGRGFATELVTGLVSEVGRPVSAGVSADNPASIRVLERAGFAPSGATRAGGLLYRFEPR